MLSPLLDYIATQDSALGLDGPLGHTRLLEGLAYISTELHKSYRPFFKGADVSFVDYPEPRCPCVLVLDVSASMSGRPISELNTGLKQLPKELASDPFGG